MGPIDRVGTFLGKPAEWGVTTTREKKLPQFNVRLVATKKWVDDPEEMTAFGITEPGYVDWSGYEQDITGYLCLFGEDKNNPGQMKPLLNYEQLKLALGWDGASFAALAGGDWSKTEILFRVEEHTWNDQTSLRVNWVDSKDASPNRTLQALDADALKGLDAQFAGVLTKAPAAAPAKAPAKPPVAGKPPVTGGAKTPPGKPGSAPSGGVTPAKSNAAAPAPSAAVPASTTTAPTTAPTSSPSKAPPVKKAVTPPAAPAAAAAGITKEEAWEGIMAAKGAKTDDDVAAAFVSAAEAIGKEEEDFTPADWAAVKAAAIAQMQG